jgi:hypothetical protein
LKGTALPGVASSINYTMPNISYVTITPPVLNIDLTSLPNLLNSVKFNVSISIPNQTAVSPTGIQSMLCKILNVSSMAGFMNPATTAINNQFAPI